MKASPGLRRKLPVIIGGAISIVIVVAVVFFIRSMLHAPAAKPKRFLPKITFIKPPPPPPPVVKPPEPKVKEVKIKQPKPVAEKMPDAPPPDLPPPGDLGLDAAGTAGSDAFGLLARQGGRGLLDGMNGKAQKHQFENEVQSDLLDYLTNAEEIRKSDYKIRIKFWFDKKGNILNFKLLGSTGNKKTDKKMHSLLAAYNKLPYPPPNGITDNITLEIVSRI